MDTAHEMLDAVLAAAADADVIVMAAAVATSGRGAPDAEAQEGRWPPDVALEPTHDFLAAGAAPARRPGPHRLRRRDRRSARKRPPQARRQGLDLIVANDVCSPGAGFDHDTNQVTDPRSTTVPRRTCRSTSKAMSPTGRR